MANLEPKKIDLSTINNGKEYENGDGTTPETFNAPIEASAYAQDFAEHLADTPDTSKANVVGTPNVELIDNVVGGKTYKKFKFSNLKGEKGDKGDKGNKGDNGNTTVNINNVPQGIVNFTSDPQTQIDTISDSITNTGIIVENVYAGGETGTLLPPAQNTIINYTNDEMIGISNALCYEIVINTFSGEPDINRRTQEQSYFVAGYGYHSARIPITCGANSDQLGVLGVTIDPNIGRINFYNYTQYNMKVYDVKIWRRP